MRFFFKAAIIVCVFSDICDHLKYERDQMHSSGFFSFSSFKVLANIKQKRYSQFQQYSMRLISKYQVTEVESHLRQKIKIKL